ncbi:MAG TPA: hypothetical protein GYA07_07855 [Verrucomicrobia bacterium]|nr:hypothetical protein [Verrucomicrobiota bacterium]HOB32305.1 hypothetical protein [Verrucomicrobiota bacterium]HOP98233.1 hypothetical protein [Verrucomicrobiota bacterium]
MKNILLAVLAIALGALIAVCAHQRSRMNVLRAQLASTEDQLAGVQAELDALRAEADEARLARKKEEMLHDVLQQTVAVVSEQSEQVARLEESLAAAQTNSGPNLAAMFSDPDMREMIRTQQKTMMGPMLDQLYGGIFSQLNLTPEQEAELRRLLEKRVLDQTEMGLAALSGDAEQREEAMRKLREQSKEVEGALRELLGDEAYAAFEDYEKRAPDRTTITQFRNQLTTPLDPAVEQQLIDALYQERSGFNWTTDFSSQDAQSARNLGELLTEDRVANYIRERELMEQNYLNRVQSLLQPDQLSALEKFLVSQRNVQVWSLKMAARLFGNPNPQGQ